jgi:hypothetical protein
VESIWVAVLNISDRTAHKLSEKHQLTRDHVLDAVQCVEGLPFTWDVDADGERNAVIRATIRNRPHLVVVYPVDHPMGDVWNLATAHPD